MYSRVKSPSGLIIRWLALFYITLLYPWSHAGWRSEIDTTLSVYAMPLHDFYRDHLCQKAFLFNQMSSRKEWYFSKTRHQVLGLPVTPRSQYELIYYVHLNVTTQNLRGQHCTISSQIRLVDDLTRRVYHKIFIFGRWYFFCAIHCEILIWYFIRLKGEKITQQLEQNEIFWASAQFLPNECIQWYPSKP